MAITHSKDHVITDATFYTLGTLLIGNISIGGRPIDPFQNVTPCWHPNSYTQQELDLGAYGFSTRY